MEDSKVVPTNINAFKADLAQAERDEAEAKGRVTSLKAKIRELEGEPEEVAPVEAPAEKPADEKPTPKAKAKKAA